MACGPSDFVCQFVQFIAENEYLAGGIAEQLAKYWQDSGGTAGVIAAFLRDYGQLIIGFLGGAFGFYRYWKFREKILHERLIEYLDEQDDRLAKARNGLLQSIYRPTPGQSFSDPIFAPLELKRVLRERRWNVGKYGDVVVRSALADLNTATETITRRVAAAERGLRSHNEQLATASLAQGAIIAIQASGTNDPVRRKSLNDRALDQIRIASKIKDFSGRLELLELEAHQLRKLGQYVAADAKLKELINQLLRFDDCKMQSVRLARCKRYRAEITQIQKSIDFANNRAPSQASRNAYSLLLTSTGDQPKDLCAIDLYKRFASKLSAWELLEQAETHYLAAYVADLRNFTDVAPAQLSESLSCYHEAKRSIPGSQSLLAPKQQQLKDMIEAGEIRVTNAQAGTFDCAWVMPPDAQPPVSNNPQNNSQSVGTASSDKCVGETAKQDPIDET